MGWGDEPARYKVGDILYLIPFFVDGIGYQAVEVLEVLPPECPQHHEYRYRVSWSVRQVWRKEVYSEECLVTKEEAVARRLQG